MLNIDLISVLNWEILDLDLWACQCLFEKEKRTPFVRSLQSCSELLYTDKTITFDRS